MTLPESEVERILTAAETIERSVAVLAEKQSMERAAYKRDRESRDVVERRFVKATEAALDIAETIVVHRADDRPKSNPGTMHALAEAGVLEVETADSMAAAARFRNVLAHTYGDVIDHDVVYDALQDLERYRDFLVDVRAYLEETGVLNR
jgi:uncharacterized protein YutE (UPF0331/DUF86 family)